MNTKILSQTKNPFLQREELQIQITSEGSPSKTAVVEITKKDADLVVVKKIKTSFGTNTCVADVVVYDSKDAKDKIETIPQKVRKKLAEEQKAAEEAAKKAKEEEEKKKAEEQAAEAPKEEAAKEETKAEETKE